MKSNCNSARSMKRYAAPLLYLLPERFYKQYVVELAGEKVTNFFPLTEEIESTVWLNGIIILSSIPQYTLSKDTSFEIIIADLCCKSTDGNIAYYLSGIDLTTKTLLPDASLVRL